MSVQEFTAEIGLDGILAVSFKLVLPENLAPANAVRYDDGTLVRYDDGTLILFAD
jgi:hypothetical protein